METTETRNPTANGKRRSRVLIVDDEPKFVRGISAFLGLHGYDVSQAADGPSALELASTQRYDLILLDITMPGMDGNEVCRRIRRSSTVPIIMLTARADSAEKIRSLDTGADDYVTKPFGSDELLARVRAALRRSQFSLSESPDLMMVRGDLRIDLAGQRVTVRGVEVELPKVEFRLLCELAGNAGRVFSPSELLDGVWRPDEANSVSLVWQAVHRLRAKIEADPQLPRFILTRHGKGYYFSPNV